MKNGVIRPKIFLSDQKSFYKAKTFPNDQRPCNKAKIFFNDQNLGNTVKYIFNWSETGIRSEIFEFGQKTLIRPKYFSSKSHKWDQ